MKRFEVSDHRAGWMITSFGRSYQTLWRRQLGERLSLSHFLDRISADHLGAFLHVDHSAVGNGLVVGVKDNIDVAGMPTTAGSSLLPRDPKRRDATCVRNLKRAGCVIIGKTAMHEFAFGATCDNPHFGKVRNPHDPSRIPGGSSGGSAVAVSEGMCEAAVTTDTGGSGRIPASFCGVVGFKPRQHVISRSGVFPLSRTFDSVGAMAADVRTAAEVVAKMSLSRLELVEQERGSFRLAVPWAWLDRVDVDKEVGDAFGNVARDLPNIDLPDLDVLSDTGSLIVIAEAAAIHRDRYGRQPLAFGADIRELLDRGQRVTAIDYIAAMEMLGSLRQLFKLLLNTVDAILVPTTPCVAPLFGTDPIMLRSRLAAWTRPFNIADAAAISLPLPTNGLPIGLQIVARSESKAIQVALALEQTLADS